MGLYKSGTLKNTTKHINDALNAEIAESVTVPSEGEAKSLLALQNELLYLQADPYTANPYALLGSIIEIRKADADCPTILSFSDASIEFSPFKIMGAKIDEHSKIKEPIKRQSIIVDSKLAVSVNFLNYLAGELSNETSFSLIVFDQATGLINRDDDSWNDGVNKWKKDNEQSLSDPEVCYVYAVIGFVHKYVIRRKYKKFQAGLKGGGWGINLNGELYTSSEDYSLDIRYGLQTAVLRRPKTTGKFGFSGQESQRPTLEENQLLTALAKQKSFAIR
jgi:hypothetical protein